MNYSKILGELCEGANYQGYSEGFGGSWTKMSADAERAIEVLLNQNATLSARLRELLALMESDVEFKYVSCGETRQKVMTEARALVPAIKV